MKSKTVTRVALIAAVYVVITLIAHPISYGPVQMRVSEALTLLPYFMGYPAAIGLFLGVMIANIFGGLGLIDIIFGSLITLAAAVFTARARSIFTAGIYPVVFNALGVGLILYFVVGLRPADPLMDPEVSRFTYFVINYLAHVLFVGLGQIGAVYAVGIPLMKFLDRKVDLENL